MIISAGLESNNYKGSSGLSPNSDVILRWREQVGDKWERKESVVTDYRPYLYVDPGKLMVKQVRSNKNWRVLETPRGVPLHLVRSTITEYLWGIDVAFEDDGAVNSDGDPLLKVYLDRPNDVYRFRKYFTPTYEADVPYEDRYLIDNHETIPEYKMRKLFIDLEALQFIQGESPENCIKSNDPRDRQEVNVIGAYDNFTNQYVQWIQHENYTHGVGSYLETPIEGTEGILEFDGCQVLCKFFTDEASMLEDFVDYVDMVDPDCLLAWGMGFYDLPTLYRRLESNGISASRLSPSSLGSRRNMKAPRYKGHQYRWTEQPIVGRVVIALDRLYERIHRDSQSTNLPSMKLDVVGQRLFGRGKTKFRPDFYAKDYDQFTFNYLYYNFRDVQLMVEIEGGSNAIEGQQALQQLAPCQLKSTFYGSNYARGYFMRKADFKQRSGWGDAIDNEEWDLQGAIVLDPEELDSVGLHKNVVMLDFSGLYPSMMLAHNTSWETKVKKGEEQDDDIIGDRCRFRKAPEGVLPKCVKELDVLRDEYKAKKAEAGQVNGVDSTEYKKWDAAQKTVKRLRATFYGLMAFKGFGWADIDIARTITYGGRNALTSIIQESESLGYKVLYGHTDSIMIALGDDKTAEECGKLSIELAAHLTELMQEKLQSEAVEVEAEVLMDRFYLPRRNRYAGRIIWDPALTDPHSIAKLPVGSRIKMQGLEAKHANTAVVGRDAQVGALHLIWDDNPPEVVLKYLQSHIDDIRNGKFTIEEMSARGRLGKWLPSDIEHPLLKNGATNPNARPDSKDEDDQCYKNLGGHQKGAAWYNVVLSSDAYPVIDKGDSYYYTFAKDGPTWIPHGGYISFQNPEQISDYMLDIDLIIEKNVISKLDHILYGLGLSNEMLRGYNKTGNSHMSIEDYL